MPLGFLNVYDCPALGTISHTTVKPFVSTFSNWLAILMLQGDRAQSTSTGTLHCCADWHVKVTGGGVF
jgi:hypothetical protein